MKTIVSFDPHCQIDVGERDPDRRLLIKESVRGLQELLRDTAGLPPGAWQVSAGPPPRYLYEDANWRINYSRKSGGFFRRTVEVVIDAVRLKKEIV